VDEVADSQAVYQPSVDYKIQVEVKVKKKDLLSIY
jgi:hypothetical protein